MSSKTNYGKNMKLHTSFWGDVDTFKLFPLTQECPYTEVVYDPRTTLLVVITKNPIHKYQMIEKLDDDGNPIVAKKPKLNGKAHKEQRVMLNSLQEHFITDREEQIEFVKEFAINSENFDFEKYMRNIESEAKSGISPQQTSIFDEKGNVTK